MSISKVSYAVIDTETSIIDKGHPFNPNAKIVVAGVMPCDKHWNQIDETKYFYDKESFNAYAKDIRVVLGHNLKFDLHHLRRNWDYDITRIRARDTQYAEFLISNQLHTFPSLDDCALKYLNEQKIDTVKTEYWDKGIDTSSIPKEILLPYLEKDLTLTRKVYQFQEPFLKGKGKLPLYYLGCADLLVLEEMEYNGILYNTNESINRANELDEILTSIKDNISQYSTIPNFNINSGDHISLLLYGGVYSYDVHFPVGVYKTGKNAGQPRYKILKQEIEIERLVNPLEGSELKKEGFYSTSDETLASLKTKSKNVKRIISDLREYSKTEKLNGTYYKGIPKLILEKEWTDNILHGQLNQCVAITGRLSSSKPNQQNFDPAAKQLCVSRYD